ncbi:MAG: hypothetical protein K2I53_10605 [Lachnospiraceae bacterium]|nr:hypothetical protein [Lachnospiraceae bacterium]
MSLDDFFDKANSLYRAGEKLMKKALEAQQGQLQSRIRTSSDEQLRAMEKKLSEEGGASMAEPLLYEEMRRRHME